MSNLAKRLQKVQVPVEEEAPDVSKYSILELERMEIDFGKKHLGSTFKEVWTQDQPWIVWFVGHYPNSKKASHCLFRHYVELMVERAELTDKKVPVITPKDPLPKTGVAIGKPYPKPKAQSGATGSTGQTEGMMMPPELLAEIEDEEEPDPNETFEIIREAEQVENSQVAHLETRMLHMENALSQVIHHLEGLTNKLNQN